MPFQWMPKGIPPSKRFFDLFISIIILVVLSPVYILIALVLWAAEGRPLLFRQPRPGYLGKIFLCNKFRTMRHMVDREGKPLPDAQRVSRLGAFLRSTSLDELPEIFNVILGDMSLVGPRPLLVAYLDRYSDEQARRHHVYPGITGWAQINGRNSLTWDEKFKLDIWYVNHQSFWLDIKILFLTIWKVFKREGINQPGQATAEEFLGNKK